MIHGIISKNIKLKDNISIIPKVKAAYLDNFYKEIESMSHVTPELRIEAGTGPLNFGLYISHQMSMHKKIESGTLYGCGVNMKL